MRQESFPFCQESFYQNNPWRSDRPTPRVSYCFGNEIC